MIEFAKIREIWIASDGSGRIQEEGTGEEFLTDSDRETWLAAGSPTPSSTNRDFGPGGLTYVDLDALPLDAVGLAQYVEGALKLERQPTPLEVFDASVDLLRETVPDPTIGRAIYDFLAAQPGVTSVARVEDDTGRIGIGLTTSGHVNGLKQSVAVVLDGSTFMLFEERRDLLELPHDSDSYVAPIALVRRHYLEADLVDRLP